ncbi:MAG: hypothetical protein ACKVS9_17830 [Phycisphaerae bacterium]
MSIIKATSAVEALDGGGSMATASDEAAAAMVAAGESSEGASDTCVTA